MLHNKWDREIIPVWSLLSCRLVIAKRYIDHVTRTPVLKNLAINWTHIVSTSSGQLLSVLPTDTTCTSHTVITGAQDKLSISCYHLPFLPYCKGHSISRRKQNLPTSIARLFWRARLEIPTSAASLSNAFSKDETKKKLFTLCFGFPRPFLCSLRECWMEGLLRWGEVGTCALSNILCTKYTCLCSILKVYLLVRWIHMKIIITLLLLSRPSPTRSILICLSGKEVETQPIFLVLSSTTFL